MNLKELRSKWKSEEAHAFKGWDFSYIMIDGIVRIYIGIIIQLFYRFLKILIRFWMWELEVENLC
ncbi:hypothetical protein [Sedimentibacter sp. LTW-03]|uniref:hypothetical protein n=1 Tax=Sedimentibacter sp. LTW-03 TaxID=3453406 RepID=UPI003F8787D6